MEIERLDIDGVIYYSYQTPYPICRQKGVKTPNYEWIHNRCGGKIMVGDNAMFLCTKCGETHHVMMTRWSCPHHDSVATANIQKGSTEVETFHYFPASFKQTVGKEWLIRHLQNL